MSMLSAGMSIIGGAVSAMGAMQAAQAEADAHRYNAAVAERNKDVLRDQYAQAIIDQRLENKRTMSSIRALYGNSGMSMTGSALDVMADTKRELVLEARRIGYKSHLAQIEQMDKKNLELMGADAAETAGTISAVSAILGGIGGAANALSRTM